jgi:hypothetical protein
MKVAITQDHIDTGCSTTWADPIALALKEALGKRCTSVSSIPEKLHFRYKGVAVTVRNPPAVVGWLFKFDNGDTVEPFTYDLPIDHLVAEEFDRKGGGHA